MNRKEKKKNGNNERESDVKKREIQRVRCKGKGKMDEMRNKECRDEGRDEGEKSWSIRGEGVWKRKGGEKWKGRRGERMKRNDEVRGEGTGG